MIPLWCLFLDDLCDSKMGSLWPCAHLWWLHCGLVRSYEWVLVVLCVSTCGFLRLVWSKEWVPMAFYVSTSCSLWDCMTQQMVPFGLVWSHKWTVTKYIITIRTLWSHSWEKKPLFLYFPSEKSLTKPSQGPLQPSLLSSGDQRLHSLKFRCSGWEVNGHSFSFLKFLQTWIQTYSYRPEGWLRPLAPTFCKYRFHQTRNSPHPTTRNKGSLFQDAIKHFGFGEE